MKSNPCHNCPDRDTRSKPPCWSTCPKRAEWLASLPKKEQDGVQVYYAEKAKRKKGAHR